MRRKAAIGNTAAVSYPLYDLSPDVMVSLYQVGPTRTTVCRLRNVALVEQDFTEAELSDGTLTTFANGGYVWVIIFYDQSGNGNDMTISNINPPEICDVSGNIFYLTGTSHIAIWYNNTGLTGLNSASLGVGLLANASEFCVADTYQISGTCRLVQWNDGTGANKTQFAPATDSSIRFQGGSITGGAVTPILNQVQLRTTIKIGDYFWDWINNVPNLVNEIEGLTIIGDCFGTTINKGATGRVISSFAMGFITDQTANRTTIEDAINGVYSVY